MQKLILVTGSTDGIGLETAKMLVSMGHHVLLHGRNPDKTGRSGKNAFWVVGWRARVEGYVADLSRIVDVEALAKAVAEKHAKLDVLINNAGVFNASDPVTQDGLDVRFAVNTIAPYLADATAFAAARDVRTSDQPVLRRSVSGRSESAGSRRPPVRRRGLCAKQTRADHVVSPYGAFAQG